MFSGFSVQMLTRVNIVYMDLNMYGKLTMVRLGPAKLVRSMTAVVRSLQIVPKYI